MGNYSGKGNMCIRLINISNSIGFFQIIDCLHGAGYNKRSRVTVYVCQRLIYDRLSRASAMQLAWSKRGSSGSYWVCMCVKWSCVRKQSVLLNLWERQSVSQGSFGKWGRQHSKIKKKTRLNTHISYQKWARQGNSPAAVAYGGDEQRWRRLLPPTSATTTHSILPLFDVKDLSFLDRNGPSEVIWGWLSWSLLSIDIG